MDADEVNTAMHADDSEVEEVASEEEADSDSSSLPPGIEHWNRYLLSVSGQRPVEYWMYITSTIRDAFEMLIEQPWVCEFDDMFVATIYGLKVEWYERVTRAIGQMFDNHIVFITVVDVSASTVVTRASSASDEPLNDGILMAIRGDAPAVYRVPSDATYREAFATLTDMPWRAEYEEHFSPMVGGITMEWFDLLGTAWSANIVYHRLPYRIHEPGECVMDVIPQTPGADHPVWQAPYNSGSSSTNPRARSRSRRRSATATASTTGTRS
jgi:hypothetical protein